MQTLGNFPAAFTLLCQLYIYIYIYASKIRKYENVSTYIGGDVYRQTYSSTEVWINKLTRKKLDFNLEFLLYNVRTMKLIVPHWFRCIDMVDITDVRQNYFLSS